MYYFAAVSGRYAGILGATAAINVATRASKGAVRGVGRVGYVGGVAPAAAVGRRLGKRIGYSARDFYRPLLRTAAKGIRQTTAGRLLFGPERDDKGELLKGETGIADRAGRGIAAWTGLYKKGQMVYGWEKEMKGAGTTAEEIRRQPSKKGDPYKAAAYSRLHNKDVGRVMKFEQTQAVVDLAMEGDTDKVIQDFERVQAMVRNPYAYNNIQEDVRAELSALTFEDVVIKLEQARTDRGVAPAKIKLSDGEKNRIQRVVRDIKSTAERQVPIVTDPSWI